MKTRILTLWLLLSAFLLWSGAMQEGAAATRGRYLAGQGVIVPPDEVRIHAYIASLDYHYPVPEAELGVTFVSGNRQLSTGGQEEVIHIGIQASKRAFSDLPPLNLAFVIDHSGSMSSENKLDWVKEAFDIFIEQVRDIDFVSLVIFDDRGKVVFPSTRMSGRDKRLAFKKAVHAVVPAGGTNLAAGLRLGYQQVLANYREDYTNRVLFLTDGCGDRAMIMEMAERYRQMGINVSTIGVGDDFDLDLMNELARTGGGSSRFISDREKMEETFGSELDRMVVPQARNLKMTLEFLPQVEILETWGYQHLIRGRTIHYSQATLHHGDYETILAHVRIPPREDAGSAALARFTVEYDNLEGKRQSSGPHLLNVEFVDSPSPVTGFSNGLVLHSGTEMHFARSLQMIGELYYSCRPDIDAINLNRDILWRSNPDKEEVVYEDLTNPEIRRLEDSVSSRLDRALDLTLETKKEVSNARLRLDNQGFEDELMILDSYIRILGQELDLEQDRCAELAADLELKPPVAERPLRSHLEHLFREMTLDLHLKKAGVVAVSGFTVQDGRSMGLLNLLNEMAVVEIGRIDTLTLVEREKLDLVLEEQALALSDLVDTSKAITIGRLLTADYIVTGSVIEMSGSLVIFGRIVNIESGEIESVAQVIVPRNREIESLLI